jgi:hypothetical protein
MPGGKRFERLIFWVVLILTTAAELSSASLVKSGSSLAINLALKSIATSTNKNNQERLDISCITHLKLIMENNNLVNQFS